MGKDGIVTRAIYGLVPSHGDIILFDDLESVFNWQGIGTGASWTVAKNTTVTYTGNGSLCMQTRTIDPAIGDYVEAYRNLFLPLSHKVSLSLYFYMLEYYSVDSVYFRFRVWTGTVFNTAYVRYKPNANTWEYMNVSGSYVVVPGITQKLESTAWHKMNMEVDFSGVTSGVNPCKYLRLESNNKYVDMSKFADGSLSVGISGARERLEVRTGIVTNLNASASVYVDDILVRQIR